MSSSHGTAVSGRRNWLLAACLWTVLLGCDRHPGSTAPVPGMTDRGVRVRTVKPSRRDVIHTIMLPATVRANLEVTLHGKVTGYIKSITKDRGDHVRTGELIATLEVPEMAMELESVRASFALEDSTLQRLEAIRKLERTAVTDQDLDLARAKRAMAEASLKRLQTMLSYTEIRAPFDGTVTERFVDPGAFVQQGRIVSIVDASKVRILVDIPESEVRSADAGDLAQVHLDALPGSAVTAKITRCSSALDPATRTMRVELEIANPGYRILPGMFARVELDVERHRNVLAVPTKAVVTQHEKAFVFVYSAGHAQKISIQTGTDDGAWTETTGGLTGEETILMPDSHILVEGMPVNLAEGS